MAAVTDVVKRVTGNLGIEVIQCVGTAGETYVSRFGTIIGAWANSTARTGMYCSWSGGTVTIQGTNVSDDTVCIIIVGY